MAKLLNARLTKPTASTIIQRSSLRIYLRNRNELITLNSNAFNKRQCCLAVFFCSRLQAPPQTAKVKVHALSFVKHRKTRHGNYEPMACKVSPVNPCLHVSLPNSLSLKPSAPMTVLALPHFTIPRCRSSTFTLLSRRAFLPTIIDCANIWIGRR